jgi:hypothetical protein
LTSNTTVASRENGVSNGRFRDYSLYGMSLRSEIPLSFPEHATDAAPDVTFSLKPERWFAGVRSTIADADMVGAPAALAMLGATVDTGVAV